MKKLCVLAIIACVLFFACYPPKNGNVSDGNAGKGTAVSGTEGNGTAAPLPASGHAETPAPKPLPENIKIASFNAQILGQAKLAKPNTLTVLASVVAHFDVVALEEVGSNSSASSDSTCTAIMNAFVERVNEISKPVAYAYTRADQYAIVYRTDRVRLIGSAPYSGAEKFTYLPLTAYFSSLAGNFDFTMLVIHTSPSAAVREIPELKTAMAEVSKSYSEPDVICLGDFNGDGSYFAEGNGPSLAGFDDYITGIPNGADTTVASASYTYDRIEMTNSLASDYANEWGVFVFSDYFDISRCEGSVSDHYPVYCEYYVDRDTD